MIPKRAVLLVLSWLPAVGLAAPAARAQMDAEHPPEPPTARLEALRPFFGLYAHRNAEWRDVGRFNGTMEIGPALKGWYVEWRIDTQSGAIDREARLLITWDQKLQRYRVWGFATNPQDPPGAVEGTARLVGDTLVMEWEGKPGPPGAPPATYRNRLYMAGPDELVSVTDVLPKGKGEPIVLGEWHNARRM